MRFYGRSLLSSATAAVMSVPVLAVQASAAAPQVVTSADDLPRYSYAVEGRLADLLGNQAALAPLAAKLRVDTEATLANYRIDDRATLRGLHRVLLNLAMLRGDGPAARSAIAAILPLQDKPADKSTTGFRELSYLDALSAGAAGTPAFKARYQASYTELVSPLPWEIVGSKLQESAGMASVLTTRYVQGVADNELQPAASAGKAIDAAAAAQLISLAVQYRLYAPLARETEAVMRNYISTHASVKPEIWAARTATLTALARLTPVTVAVWDSGFDTDLFRGRIWTNASERLDGKDDDGNGYVDDVHGVAYDMNGQKEVAPLTAIPVEIAPRLDTTRLLVQGMMDQQAGIDSPDANHLRQLAGDAPPDVMKRTLEDLNFYFNYAHGTHVAGIVADGNPAIRLLVARLQSEWHSPPRRPTQATAEATARMYGEVVGYMKKAGVRIVNMSWGVALKTEYEDLLAANGVPAGIREVEARRLFAIDSKGLRDAIASAPEILFVCAAGNDNDSASFSGGVPASIDVPNVLAVAAVDQAGVPTRFTSGGPTVHLAANGYQVDSMLPGGSHQRWSGTSMASPAVVNAAAKLLAVDPKLTVADLRRLLLDTATGGSGGLRLLDGKAALAKVPTQ